MAQRGRKPKPRAVRELEGNQEHRPLPDDIPEPTSGAPRCPPTVQGEARKEWERLCAELEELGLLSGLDSGALAAYCQAWADFCWANDYLRRRPRVVLTPNKLKQVHPVMTARRQAAEQMLKFAAEFGLTPSARMRIRGTTGGTKTDKFSDYLDGKPKLEGIDGGKAKKRRPRKRKKRGA